MLSGVGVPLYVAVLCGAARSGVWALPIRGARGVDGTARAKGVGCLGKGGGRQRVKAGSAGGPAAGATAAGAGARAHDGARGTGGARRLAVLLRCWGGFEEGMAWGLAQALGARWVAGVWWGVLEDNCSDGPKKARPGLAGGQLGAKRRPPSAAAAVAAAGQPARQNAPRAPRRRTWCRAGISDQGAKSRPREFAERGLLASGVRAGCGARGGANRPPPSPAGYRGCGPRGAAPAHGLRSPHTGQGAFLKAPRARARGRGKGGRAASWQAFVSWAAPRRRTQGVSREGVPPPGLEW